MSSRPVVVVLAAGRSSRYGAGRHKLEQPLGGTTVLGHTLRHVRASHLPLVVVTSEPLAPLARGSVAARDLVVLDPQAPSGMGHSIAAGVAARAQAGGWLVLPGDMPLVQPQTLQQVAAALAHHPLAFAQYRGQRGHPVGFGTELFTELVMLDGDEGARRLVARYPAHAVEVDDPGVLVDVDTPDDLRSVTGGSRAVPTPFGAAGSPK